MSTAKNELTSIFKSKDLGEISHVLGLRVSRDRKDRSVTMDQAHLIEKFQSQYEISGTALTPGFWKSFKDDPNTQTQYDTSKLQSMVGSLLYLGLHTRSDILFATTHIARQLHSPAVQTDIEVRRIFEYLNNSKGHALRLDCSNIATIRAFSDSNLAGKDLSRRSVSGTIIFLGNSPICWSSKGQKCAALSTMESELIASTLGCQDALWLRNLLSGLLPTENIPIQLFSDNLPSIKYSSNLSNDSMARHISLRYHFVRLLKESGEIELVHVRSRFNPADMFTKHVGPNILKDLSPIAGLFSHMI